MNGAFPSHRLKASSISLRHSRDFVQKLTKNQQKIESPPKTIGCGPPSQDAIVTLGSVTFTGFFFKGDSGDLNLNRCI